MSTSILHDAGPVFGGDQSRTECGFEICSSRDSRAEASLDWPARCGERGPSAGRPSLSGKKTGEAPPAGVVGLSRSCRSAVGVAKVACHDVEQGARQPRTVRFAEERSDASSVVPCGVEIDAGGVEGATTLVTAAPGAGCNEPGSYASLALRIPQPGAGGGARQARFAAGAFGALAHAGETQCPRVRAHHGFLNAWPSSRTMHVSAPACTSPLDEPRPRMLVSVDDGLPAMRPTSSTTFGSVDGRCLDDHAELDPS